MKGKKLALIALVLLTAVLIFTACKKKEENTPGGTGMHIYVTDENGNTVLGEDGQPLTEEWVTKVVYATDENGETYTDSSGQKVTVKQTMPLITSVVIRTKPVTDKNGEWKTNKDGSYITEAMTIQMSQVVTDKNGNNVTQVVTDKGGEKVTEPNGQVVTEPVTEIYTEKLTHTIPLTLQYQVTKHHTTQKQDTPKTTSIYENPEYTQPKTTSPNQVTLPSTGKFAATQDWIKSFGGSKDDRYRKVLTLNSNSFVALGVTNSPDGTFESFSQKGLYSVLTKFNADGTVIWSCPIGSTGTTQIYDFATLSDGSFIAVGYSSAKNLGFEGGNATSAAIIVKISPKGSVLWYKHIGGSKPDYFTAVAPTSDGGFVATGKFTSTDGDFSDLSINNTDGVTIKFNNNGDIVWQQKFGGSGIDAGAAIGVAKDGTIYTAYRTVSKDGDATGSNGSADVFVVKYSAAGQKLWAKHLAGSKTEDIEDIYVGANGCIVLGRYTSNDGVFGVNRGSYDAFMAYIDAEGKLNWVKTYGGINGERFYGLVPTPTGYAVVGVTTSANRDFEDIGNKGSYDAFIMSTDKNGNVLDVEALAGSGADGCYDICRLDSKTFIVVGETYKTDGSFEGLKPAAGSSNSTAYIAKYKIY